MRYFFILLIIALMLTGCSQTERSLDESIIMPDKFNDHLKIIDVWLEEEGEISNYPDVYIKYQNISDKALKSISIDIHYLDKSGKRIGTAASFIDEFLRPNEIRVQHQSLSTATLKPEHIKEEWSGKLEFQINTMSSE